MASNASQSTNRDPLARRSSFRKSLAEAGLSSHFLETLEQKRRQLDDSIHKYIAAKEREYKQFEKELRTQHKAQGLGNVSNGQSIRRTSTEEGRQSPVRAHMSAIDTLLEKGSRRGSDSHPLEGVNPVAPMSLPEESVGARLKDRRISTERDKAFVGVFVPPFIPALDTEQNVRASSLERTTSALSAVEKAKYKESIAVEKSILRVNSDTVIQAPQANPKRPAHLQLSQRTSSSGSSVEGRLVSAMKSPTEHVRSKQKRVSLAVGDAIVAPSDNVPASLSNNKTPSHSRTRAPASDRSNLLESEALAAASGEPQKATCLTVERIEPRSINGAAAGGLKTLHDQKTAAEAQLVSPIRSVPTQPTGANVGEFWHLEEPDASEGEHALDSDFTDEFNEDLDTSVSDRISDRNAISASTVQEGAPADDSDHLSGSHEEAAYLEFLPATPASSQQPTNPGFRRPSVAQDPAYTGRDYTRAAMNADENEVYGSSYSRPQSKGSFTTGSLGETYMAQHAEQMGRLRGARQEAQAKS